jgi:hypothetical protein
LEVVEKLEELPDMGQYASIIKKLSRAIEEYDCDEPLNVLDKFFDVCIFDVCIKGKE